MCNGALFLLLLTSLWPQFSYADCPDHKAEINDEERLFKTLKCNFKDDYRPVKDYKATVDVKLRFDFKYFVYDAAKETISIHSWVVFNWKDEFLSWNSSEYGGIKEMLVKSYDIWSPRMMLINQDATLYQHDSIYTICLLSDIGMVTCVPRIPYIALCQSQLRNWPYDEQTCNLHLGSWMNKEEQVNLTFYENNPITFDDFQDGPGWKLLKVIHDRLPGKQQQIYSSNRTEPNIKLTFLLRREAAGLAILVIVPSIVMVLLLLPTLLIHVKDNIRLMLMCFILFKHFAVMILIGFVVPNLSSDTPFILLFTRDSMIYTLVCILETLLLMYFTKKTLPAPTWIISVNRLFTSTVGRYVPFSDIEPCADLEENLITEEGTTNTTAKSQINVDWIKFANLFNSCFFILSVLFYFIIICKYIPT